MTRAEFWGRKLLLADSLNSETVRNMLKAAKPEVVSNTTVDGVTIMEFVDQSFLRATPVDTPLGTKGLVEWTE